MPTGRGCAFLNAAEELSADHPAQDVIGAHDAAVRALLADCVRQDRPDPDPQAAADELFLLLEGSVAHRGIDAGGSLPRTARERAVRLLNDA
jgi:hypothetical protein